MTGPAPAGRRWIARATAIGLVLAAQGVHTVGSRSSARSLLATWIGAGQVRTREGEQPAWAKRPRRQYLRADVLRKIADRRAWRPDEDSLLGTAYDRVVALHLGRGTDAVRERRLKLHIRPFGPSSRGATRGGQSPPLTARPRARSSG